MEAKCFDEIKAWLVGFSDCVNTLDYVTVKDLFSDMVKYCGIHVAYTQWVDNVIEEEWQKEWPHIKDFSWGYENRIIFTSEKPFQASLFLNWKCIGYDAYGKESKRTGRATWILVKPSDSPLKCCHGHFTLNPNVPFRTYGPLRKE